MASELNKNKSILALIIVSFCYALMSVVSRWLSLGFEPFTQVYLRLFGAFLITLIIFSKKIRFKKLMITPASDWFLLAIMGIFGYGLSVYFLTQGALNTQLVNVSVILATVPFFSYFLSLFFLKSKFNIKIALISLVSFYGVSIISNSSFIPKMFSFGKGELFVLIGSFLLATYSVSRKRLSEYLNDQEITVIVIFLAFVTSFIFALANGEKISVSSFTLLPVIVGLFLGAVLNIMSTYLESFSFKHLEVVLGNQLLLLENLFAPLFGYFLYQEHMNLYQLSGALLIIGGVYLNNKSKN